MTLPNDGMTETAIHDWLVGYAWADDTDKAKEARVKCIMAQGNWKYLDAQAEQFAGAQWEPGPKAFAEGMEFALSALYETHDGPHIDGCPSLEWERRARQDLGIE